MPDCPGSLYFAEMADGPMNRIRVPGGEITSPQLRALAEVARTGGNGLVDLTNRANLQIRGLTRITPDQLEARLIETGMMPDQGSRHADRLRNIMADPLAGLDESELIDSGPVVAVLDCAIQAAGNLRNLSPKFSFVIDNGGRSNISGTPHEVALVAERHGGEVLYRLVLAGRPAELTTKPENAAALAMAAARSALRLAGDEDQRYTRLLQKMSFERVVQVISKTAGDTVAQSRAWNGEPRMLAPSIGAVKQRQSDRFSVGLGVPLSRLTDRQFTRLAELADEFGTGRVRLSPWQVIFVPDVKAADLPALFSAAQDRGFVTDSRFLQTSVMACSGVRGCPRTKLDTHDAGAALVRHFAQNKQHTERPRMDRLSIHVSGCARGCAHHRKSDILALARDDGRGYDLYRDASPSAPAAEQRFGARITPEDLTDFIDRNTT